MTTHSPSVGMIMMRSPQPQTMELRSHLVTVPHTRQGRLPICNVPVAMWRTGQKSNTPRKWQARANSPRGASV
jgi:hypothetical protein